MVHIYIFCTVLFTVYGLLVLKWRIVQYGLLPLGFQARLLFLLQLFLDPYVFSGLVGGLIASMCWMAAMTKADLSRAYPFTSLSYVLVMLLSGILLHEPITMPKILGAGFIVVGIIVGSLG